MRRCCTIVIALLLEESSWRPLRRIRRISKVAIHSPSCETIPALAQAVAGWTPEQFERPVAPGKWTIKQILTHLAQTEMALGTRARMALTRSAFVAQSFDQDGWLAREHTMSGPDAVQAFVLLATMNLNLYATLSDADRETPFTHDEYGPMTVDWIIYQKPRTSGASPEAAARARRLSPASGRPKEEPTGDPQDGASPVSIASVCRLKALGGRAVCASATPTGDHSSESLPVAIQGDLRRGCG